MPIAARIYINPSDERARLEIDRMAGPDRRQWWSVALVREGGSVVPVAGRRP